MSNPAGTNAKYGRNKGKCERYAKKGTRKLNKQRKIARHLKRVTKTA